MDKRKDLPRLGKTVSAFLSNEDGKILKKSMVTLGSIVGGIAVAKLVSNMIPQVEASSHTDHASHNQRNDIIGGYDDSNCAITARHELHSESIFTNSK